MPAVSGAVTAALSPEPGEDPLWWRHAVVYQIYPRSFADANGDGIGDLRGILSRVPYLRRLGVDAVWLSPFYPSALADGGYDVDDHRDVDPRIGTLAEFDELVAALHGAGIRILVDIVPNHSSNRHPWFHQALAAPAGSGARARYVFRDGTGPRGDQPPTDWRSIFGGSAWTRVPDGQWYLHLFAPEQPDFDWSNPDVGADFIDTIRFWSDRGVDGFRVDVAHGLVKDLSEPLPSSAEIAQRTAPGEHPLFDRDGVHEIYAQWRRVFDEYAPPRVAVAEAWAGSIERRLRYASPRGLGQAFSFDLLHAPFDAGAFAAVVTENLAFASASGSSTTWVLSNHDEQRHATRYGLRRSRTDAEVGVTPSGSKDWLLQGAPQHRLDRARGVRRARAAVLFELALPGSTYLYQGEELGLHEVVGIPDDQRQDPAFFRNRGVEIGRDGCRVPLPWTRGGPSFGFGDAGSHLPQPGWFSASSVEVQDADPASTLALYRAALDVRRRLRTGESLDWVDTGRADVLHFRRAGGWECVTNFGPSAAALPSGTIVLASGAVANDLPPETTVWLQAPRDR